MRVLLPDFSAIIYDKPMCRAPMSVVASGEIYLLAYQPPQRFNRLHFFPQGIRGIFSFCAALVSRVNESIFIRRPVRSARFKGLSRYPLHGVLHVYKLILLFEDIRERVSSFSLLFFTESTENFLEI